MSMKKEGLPESAILWLANGRRGISSNTMFTHITGIDAMQRSRKSHPHDPDDLDRCLLLLDAVPEFRSDMPKMRSCSKHWAALIDNWNSIELSHLNEVGLGWTKARSAPKTYELMKEILNKVMGKE